MTTPGPNDPNDPNGPTGPSPQDPSVGRPGQGWGQQPPPSGPAQPGQAPQQGQPGQFGQQGPPQGQPGQFGQQGPPQGQPGQFGQQGGFDQQGQPWAGQQASGQGSTPEKPGWKKRLPLIIGAVVVALGLALFRNGVFGGGEPEAGDCTNGSPTQLEVVDCDSDEASYRVAGVVEDVSENDLEGDQTLCTNDWPDSVAYAVTETDPAEQGTGFCLESL